MVHVAPPLTKRKIPLSAATVRVAGATELMTREPACRSERPVFIGVQWSPLSVEQKTPPPFVAAYSTIGIAGSAAREVTFRWSVPSLSLIHISEPTRLGMISY